MSSSFKLLRQKQGYTAEDVSIMTGQPVSTVQGWDIGRPAPNIAYAWLDGKIAMREAIRLIDEGDTYAAVKLLTQQITPDSYRQG